MNRLELIFHPIEPCMPTSSHHPSGPSPPKPRDHSVLVKSPPATLRPVEIHPRSPRKWKGYQKQDPLMTSATLLKCPLGFFAVSEIGPSPPLPPPVVGKSGASGWIVWHASHTTHACSPGWGWGHARLFPRCALPGGKRKVLEVRSPQVCLPWGKGAPSFWGPGVGAWPQSAAQGLPSLSPSGGHTVITVHDGNHREDLSTPLASQSFGFLTSKDHALCPQGAPTPGGLHVKSLPSRSSQHPPPSFPSATITVRKHTELVGWQVYTYNKMSIETFLFRKLKCN